MQIRKLFLIVPLLAAAGSVLAQVTPATGTADTTYTLKRTVKMGDALQYKLTVKASVGGLDGTLHGTAVDEVKKADETGYTVSEKWKDSKFEFNGQESEGPQLEFSLSYLPTNELKDITGGTDVNEQYKTWFFLYDTLHSLRQPDKAVKVGDEWTAKVAPTSTNGNVGADLSYKLDGVETLDSVETLRVKMSAKQTAGGDTSSEMTIWVSKADGSVVKIDGTILKLSFPDLPVPVDAKYTLERIKG